MEKLLGWRVCQVSRPSGDDPDGAAWADHHFHHPEPFRLTGDRTTTLFPRAGDNPRELWGPWAALLPPQAALDESLCPASSKGSLP